MINGILNTAGYILTIRNDIVIPAWVWVLTTGLSLPVAQFLAYHHKRIKPTLMMCYENTPDYLYPNMGNSPVRMVGLLKIINKAPAEAKNCRVRITELEPASLVNRLTVKLPVELDWVPTDSTIYDLHPRGEAFVRFWQFIQPTSTDRVYRLGGPRHGFQLIDEQIIVTLVAWAENAVAQEERFRVEAPSPASGQIHLIVTRLLRDGA